MASFFGWWYGEGIAWLIARIKSKLAQMADYFSIGLLVKTMFQPLRMIDANSSVKGTLEVRLQAAMFKLLSRLIGGFMRSTLMIIGLLVMGGRALFGGIQIVFWLLMPIIPVICVILFAAGVAPSWSQ